MAEIVRLDDARGHRRVWIGRQLGDPLSAVAAHVGPFAVRPACINVRVRSGALMHESVLYPMRGL